MKTFEQWDIDDVERTFGLSRHRQYDLLTEWLTVPHAPNPAMLELLKTLQDELIESVSIWTLKVLITGRLIAALFCATEARFYAWHRHSCLCR